MPIDINEDNVKEGVLGLAVAIVEIIVETLRHQAVRRMECGSLDDDEIERLGRVFRELDLVLEVMKDDCGIQDSVQSVRDGLDSVLGDLLGDFNSGCTETPDGGSRPLS